MIEAKLREYEVLRSEIISILEGIRQFFMFAILAIGGILSYGITAKNGYIFLIGPLVVISVMSYTRALNLSLIRIATYIRCVIEERTPGLNWESVLFDIRTTTLNSWSELPWGGNRLAIIVVYDALAISCISVSFLYPIDRMIVSILAVFLLLILTWVNFSYYWSTRMDRFKEFEERIRSSKILSTDISSGV